MSSAFDIGTHSCVISDARLTRDGGGILTLDVFDSNAERSIAGARAKLFVSYAYGGGPACNDVTADWLLDCGMRVLSWDDQFASLIGKCVRVLRTTEGWIEVSALEGASQKYGAESYLVARDKLLERGGLDPIPLPEWCDLPLYAGGDVSTYNRDVPMLIRLSLRLHNILCVKRPANTVREIVATPHQTALNKWMGYGKKSHAELYETLLEQDVEWPVDGAGIASRVPTSFQCVSCGYESVNHWVGRCPGCHRLFHCRHVYVGEEHDK